MDEAGKKEIAKRFEDSWITTEVFFDSLIQLPGFEPLVPIREFMRSLKQSGEYKHFRAGTSVHILMLSRSVNFGLRKDQKYISIDAFKLNDYEIKLRDGEKTYRQYRIQDLDDAALSRLLVTLKHVLID